MRLFPAVLAALLTLTFGYIRPDIFLNASEWHVSPTGSPAGDGSQAKPWDFPSVLKHPPAVKPGDTIWLAPGTYSPNLTTRRFASQLAGTATSPITIRGRGRATIDLYNSAEKVLGLQLIVGPHTVWRDLEFTSSIPRPRITSKPGSWVQDVDRGEVQSQAEGTWFVNCVFHDLNNGLAHQHLTLGGGIYGCISYNNGWVGPDRGHGHAFYAQNLGPLAKRITNCMGFNNHSTGLNIYSAFGSLVNIEITDCSWLDNANRNVIVGGYGPSAGIVGSRYERNVGWLASGQDTLDFGYQSGTDKDAVIRDNYVAGAFRMLQPFPSLEFTGNEIVGGRNNVIAEFRFPTGSKPLIDRNSYVVSLAKPILDNGTVKTFSQWQAAGYDVHSTVSAIPANRVFIRPNEYERGRAHVTIVNWEKRPTVEVDMAGVIPLGSQYSLWSVYDLFGLPLLSGIYSGPLQVPMGTVPAPIPFQASSPVALADIRCGAFLVRSVTDDSIPPPLLPPPVSPPPPPPPPLPKDQKYERIEFFRGIDDGKIYYRDGDKYKLLELR